MTKKANSIEDAFDRAITKLHQGVPVDLVVLDYPEYKDELLELLPVVTLGYSIPKLSPARAVRQYRFANKHQNVFTLLKSVLVMRYAVIPSAVVVVFGSIWKISRAAAQSLPGTPLYSLKKAYEIASLKLTTDPDQKITLQLQFTQKRFQEAQAALTVEPKNDRLEAAALSELSSQTQATFNFASSVAATKAIAGKDNSLLKDLVAINNKQQDLLSNVKSYGEAKTAADQGLKTTTETKKALAAIIATVNEQVFANLAHQQPDAITITGTVSGLEKNKIEVEKNVFIIDANSVVKQVDTTSTSAALKLKDKVSILGVKTDKGLVATQIVILSTEETAVDAPVATKPAVKPTAPTKSDAPSNTDTETVDQISPKPLKAGIIPEDPSPQFAP